MTACSLRPPSPNSSSWRSRYFHFRSCCSRPSLCLTPMKDIRSWNLESSKRYTFVRDTLAILSRNTSWSKESDQAPNMRTKVWSPWGARPTINGANCASPATRLCCIRTRFRQKMFKGEPRNLLWFNHTCSRTSWTTPILFPPRKP